MNKTLKISLEIALALVAIVLAVVLYSSIMKPVKFDNEFTKRGAACAEKLKAIRTLEESYNQTYGSYTGSFDTLFARLLDEDSMRISVKVVNYEKIPEDVSVEDMPELEAMKLGYISRKDTLVNPVQQLLDANKLPITNPDGSVRQMTREEILNLRYIPYPKGTKEQFQISAGHIEKSGFQVPVVEVKVELKTLMSDLENQMVINKIAELEHNNKYAGWKFGSMDESIVDGNFE